MQIFIDSANPTEIKEMVDLGIIDGVTTNPTLATKAGIKFKEAAMKILDIANEVGKFPVSLEVLSTDYEGMMKEAKILANLNVNVVVKIPMSLDGVKAVKHLSEEGIKTNMTLIFNPVQALLAAKAGATYISPFIGRLNDIASSDSDELIHECTQMIQTYLFESKILYASVRTAQDLRNAMKYHADAITVPYEILKKLTTHPLTDAGLKKFLDDWRASGEEYLF